MRLICPHCGAEGTVDDSYMEKMVQCPKCETSFGVFPWRKNSLSEDEDVKISPVISSPPPTFPIISVIKDVWEETKGAKASIWAAIAVIYFVMLLLEAATSFLMSSPGLEQTTNSGLGFGSVIQLLISAVSAIFTAGLLYIGVKKAAGNGISWKMIFSGFSFAPQIVLATALQAIFVAIGLLLLVLPGLYLAVGYGVTLPLIMDRGMSAWEAMEASRKAIHKVWWKVTGAIILMGLIQFISAIPFGIGLIWTVPMFIILVGVVYHRLFDGAMTDQAGEV